MWGHHLCVALPAPIERARALPICAGKASRARNCYRDARPPRERLRIGPLGPSDLSLPRVPETTYQILSGRKPTTNTRWPVRRVALEIDGRSLTACNSTSRLCTTHHEPRHRHGVLRNAAKHHSTRTSTYTCRVKRNVFEQAVNGHPHGMSNVSVENGHLPTCGQMPGLCARCDRDAACGCACTAGCGAGHCCPSFLSSSSLPSSHSSHSSRSFTRFLFFFLWPPAAGPVSWSWPGAGLGPDSVEPTERAARTPNLRNSGVSPTRRGRSDVSARGSALVEGRNSKHDVAQ